ncbi:PREDICTED: uncharacterized protein LOC106815675 [Priapulus caudatus]|uniref:Uncharacterized protein LOC106815675 n=1 Tax=Priapulus caudatus TaxID=37621 RepID=A0ABM1ETZ0_PRICU|nr:PREDICTED: uncharacterized protein LOC106815675 [Priapulus caudatus]
MKTLVLLSVICAAVVAQTGDPCQSDCRALMNVVASVEDRCPTSRVNSRCTDDAGTLQCDPPTVRYSACDVDGKTLLYRISTIERDTCICLDQRGREFVPPGVKKPYSKRQLRPRACNAKDCNCPVDADTVEELTCE